MESCMLCFNFIPVNNALQLDHCFASNLAGSEIIQNLFPAFAEVAYNCDLMGFNN